LKAIGGFINDLLGFAIPILTVERQSDPVHYKQTELRMNITCVPEAED
jgi:hypothetical protein